MRPYSDDLLIQALSNGDNDALEYVYKTYWPMVLHFVQVNSGVKDDARELYQESIIALYEKSKDKQFKLTCSLKTYIYSICRNKWMNQLRNKRVVDDIEEYTDTLSDDTDDQPELIISDVEMAEAISGMGDPCKSLLLGFYYEKISLDLLALKLKYASANVAKQQKFRCIERLKKRFLVNQNHVTK